MKSRNRISWYGYGMVVVTAIILAGTQGCSKRAEAPPAQPIAVRVAALHYEDLVETVNYLGTVHSAHEVLVTSRIQGTVQEIPRKEGDKLKEGDVIVQISAVHLDAAVARLQADDAYWSQRLAEDRRLAESGSVPQEQVKASTRSAAVARAALGEAEDMRTWALERSPFAGLVLEWRVEPGQHVMPGKPLMLIGDAALEIHVPILEEDLRRGIGLQTSATVEMSDGRIVVVKVSEIGSISQHKTRSFNVIVPLPAGQEPDLRVGESVPVRFHLRTSSGGATVPARAIAGSPDNAYIFLIENGRARRWDVKPGVSTNGRVAIEPKPPVALVAISNLDELADGDPVFAVSEEGDRP